MGKTGAQTTLDGDTVRGGTKSTTGVEDKPNPWETAAVEDWPIALQIGLACLSLWQQSILPDIDFMAQVWADFSMAAWQKPQGVRATMTPNTKTIRLMNESVCRMLKSYTHEGKSVKQPVV